MMGYENAKQAISESIAAANLGYIDLYDRLDLINVPWSANTHVLMLPGS